MKGDSRSAMAPLLALWILTFTYLTVATDVEPVSIPDPIPDQHVMETSTFGADQHACRLPSSWHGDWHEYTEGTGGTTLVTINDTHISAAGRCGRLTTDTPIGGYKNEKEYKVLIVDTPKGRSTAVCWLCMLVFERHHNIIQYRLSDQCSSDPEGACLKVNINTPIKIMFRADAAVEACPVSGPANFSFSSVDAEHCDTLKSTIAGCVDESRLRLNYISCPGMTMESRVDDLLCIGRFEAFGRKYFVAKMINKASADESKGDLLRCFMYQTTPSGGTLMMSGDASCQSLDIDQPSIRLKYVAVDAAPKPDCVFRPWLRHRHHKDTEITWESLSSNGNKHIFDRHKWTVERTDGEGRSAKAKTIGTTTVQTVNWCVHYVSDHKDEKSAISGDGTRLERLIVYTIDECERGYRCVEFYHHAKRTRNQVMDVLIGKFAPTSYEACKPEYFEKGNLHFETLLDSASREQECPSDRRGQYRIRGCEENDAALYFGCGEGLSHALIFYEDCNQKSPGLYHCYGDWTDPENPFVHYLAVKDTSTGKKTCFAYSRTAEDEELAMSTFKQHSCKRGILPGVNGHRTYNLTKTGLCDKIPWHVANLTQSDASARYDESSLSARSINGRPGGGATTTMASMVSILLSFVVSFVLRTIRNDS